MNDTVKSWGEHWLAEYDRKTSSPSTVQAHGYLFKNHIFPRLGHIPLEALTEENIHDLLSDSPCSEAAKRNISAVLRKCLQQTVAEGLLEANPVATGLYKCPDTVTANILTPREAQDYLIEAERQNRLPMFQLLLTTGIKVGELIQIRWTDLIPSEEMLTIHGQRSRKIPLESETLALLRREYAGHRSAELLFLHPGSLKPYTRGEIYCYHRKIIEACGLEGIRLCDLRHSYAVNALKDGMDPIELAAILGHSDPHDVLRIYSPYLPRQKKKRERVTN